MFTPRRIVQEELLDEDNAPRADMERSLRDLRRINRYLGGIDIYRRLLDRLPLGDKRAVVVDLGAGTTDLLDALPGKHLRVGLDCKLEHLLYLRNGSPSRRVVGDATRLPFRDGSVDAVTSAHFFHHFEPHENTQILGEALRVARRGVVINDTRRHWIPLFIVTLLGALRLVGRITRFDAPASVRRSYTTSEAREVGRATGAKSVEAVHVWPFRFGLLLRK